MRRFVIDLYALAGLCFILALACIGRTIFGIIRAFNEIAAKGNASPAVVAVGVGDEFISFVIGLVSLAAAIVLTVTVAFQRSRKRSKTDR